MRKPLFNGRTASSRRDLRGNPFQSERQGTIGAVYASLQGRRCTVMRLNIKPLTQKRQSALLG